MTTETVRQDDIAKIMVINANFNLSGNTELRMVFRKSDGSIVEKLKADGVTAPAVDFTVCVGDEEQTFLANKYWLYDWVPGDLDQAGTWSASGIYIEGANKRACGNSVKFEVLNC